jgi:two-component system response regulator EvgA
LANTILIVDDYAPFRETARSLLEAEGFTVVGEAENGIAALRIAKELLPKIVLLDVSCPTSTASRLQTGCGGSTLPRT